MVWHYREKPHPEHVPHLFQFLEKQRLLWNRATATAYAGVVTALCECHPAQAELWTRAHPALVRQAGAIARSWDEQMKPNWGDYLCSRWMITGSDRDAWDLLLMAHSPTKERAAAAKAVIDKICSAVDGGHHMTDSKGNLVGKVFFEDMRLQIARLAREFTRMSIKERKLSFDKLHWSPETQQAQLEQQVRWGLNMGMAVGPPILIN